MERPFESHAFFQLHHESNTGLSQFRSWCSKKDETKPGKLQCAQTYIRRMDLKLSLNRFEIWWGSGSLPTNGCSSGAGKCALLHTPVDKYASLAIRRCWYWYWLVLILILVLILVLQYSSVSTGTGTSSAGKLDNGPCLSNTDTNDNTETFITVLVVKHTLAVKHA